MLKVIAEKEHYLLISDGQRFTVVERRAGKFYPLRMALGAVSISTMEPSLS